MISKISNQLFFAFSSSKYHIVKGKYLLPVPPKRLPSSFILFSNEIRPSLLESQQGAKKDITSIAKTIGEKWNQLSVQQKAKYDKKAEQNRKKNSQEAEEYIAKFVEPFKRASIQGQITKAYYASTQRKFTSIAEGAQEVKKYRESLSEQQLADFQKQVQDINSRNEKIAKQYEIPTLNFKSYRSFLSHLQKTENIGSTADLDQKTLNKYQSQYEEHVANFKSNLSNFARSFHILPKDLIKLINKQKSEEQKLSEQGNNLKQTRKSQANKIQKQLERAKAKFSSEKQKILKAEKKRVAQRLASLEKNLEKKKRISERSNKSLTTKINENKRLINEVRRTKTEKSLRKSAETNSTQKSSQTQ